MLIDCWCPSCGGGLPSIGANRQLGSPSMTLGGLIMRVAEVIVPV